ASGAAAPASPRTAEAVRSLGIRCCPKCGAGIEKQGAGFTHGCDKMTCRCGCRFCFACGLVARADGPACACVAPHHGYLSHESVMGNYSDDPFGNPPFGNPASGSGGSGANPFGAGLHAIIAEAVQAATAAATAGASAGHSQGFPPPRNSPDLSGFLGGLLGQASQSHVAGAWHWPR
ncbi:unnamed protein product, partial [Polarella glacialis]